jgi:hypothetical protein
VSVLKGRVVAQLEVCLCRWDVAVHQERGWRLTPPCRLLQRNLTSWSVPRPEALIEDTLKAKLLLGVLLCLAGPTALAARNYIDNHY